MRTRLATAVMAALLSVACGSPSAGSPGPGSTATPTPIRVTETDFGQTIRASQGQSVEVELIDRRPVPGSSLVWSVSSTDAAVLELKSELPGVAAPMKDSVYRAWFVARRAGTAKIHAAGATTCEAMLKSGCPDRSADVTIQVG